MHRGMQKGGNPPGREEEFKKLGDEFGKFREGFDARKLEVGRPRQLRRWVRKETVVQKRERITVMVAAASGQKGKSWTREGSGMMMCIYIGEFGKNCVLAPQDSLTCKLIPIVIFYSLCSFHF